MTPARRILGLRVDATTYTAATRRILAWSDLPQPRLVCCANVHMIMEAADHPGFAALLNAADLVTPDGMPLVWTLRALGLPAAERVYGPDLMRHLLAAAADRGIPVGLLGGTPATLGRLESALRTRHPALRLVYAASPPFRPATPAEDEATLSAIAAAGPRLLFVGLGCPKQERWMAAHRDRLPLVQIGVGAAFELLAGVRPQAPPLLQRAGAEWLFRLLLEPRRLWRRYLVHNPRFVVRCGAQLLRARAGGRP